MSEIDASENSLSGKLPIAAVLGLSKADDAELTQLRGLQYATLASQSRSRVFIHVALAVLAVWLFLGSVAPLWLGLWFALVVTVQIRGASIEESFADGERRSVTRSEVLRHSVTPICSGILWAVPLTYFGLASGEAVHATVFGIVAIILAVAAFFYSSAPLGIVIFATIVAAASLAGFTISGQYEMAAISTIFAGTTLFGAVEVARTNLAVQVAQNGVAEKDQVVSLLLREFEENEADWLWEVDTSRRVRSVSPRFAFALGQVQTEAEGRPLLELVAGKSWESGNFPTSLHDLAERLKHRENFSNQLVQVSIKGEARWWELSGTPMLDERGKFIGFRGVGSDVTEQRESSEKISYLARFDTLTKLPNRLQLNEALGEALRYSEQWNSRCAFLMVDLDRFKSVNDSLGHLVGDRLLAQVAGRLQSLMGDNRMCGRLGGDEFAVVIRDATDHTVIEKVAKSIIEHLSEPYTVDNHTLYVGASVGSAVGPRDGRTVEELMRNADLALYRSKDEGGGEHFKFEPGLHAHAEERRQLEVSLRTALEEEEFVLHYQPVVDANSEELVSFEALVRWNSKDHGFVSPGKFIPLAEDTRLIVPIGRWVLRQACIEARSWPEHVKVNVNVSPEQLLEQDFTDDVVSALAETGLRPERLEIEVTESIFLRDATIARNALEQVMALGCSVALDDFGTGYSSLGYLRKLRFSTIKVDRTFVQGAAQQSAESLAIIRAVVAMAQSLDMTTTAEGVETADEAALIRSMGCDKIQGFYFGRPLPAEDARRLFKTIKRKSA
ncbi:MAG: EAL domain-containing protein [Erythrobacter sp.]